MRSDCSIRMFQSNSAKGLKNATKHYYYLLAAPISIFHFQSIPVFLEFYLPLFITLVPTHNENSKSFVTLVLSKIKHVKQVYFNQTVTKQLNSKTGGYLAVIMYSQYHLSTGVHTHLPKCKGKFMMCALYILRCVRRAEAMSNNEKFKLSQ